MCTKVKVVVAAVAVVVVVCVVWEAHFLNVSVYVACV